MPQLTWGEFVRGLWSIGRADTRYGRRVLFRTRWGAFYLNKNVERRLRKMNVLNGEFKPWLIPKDWLVTYDGEWIYRIASPLYVDVPPSIIEGLLKEVGLPISLGKWGNRVVKSEGATYGEFTISYTRASSPRVGDYVAGLRIVFGNDGYTAFRVFRFFGILKCENGLIMGVEDVTKLLHARHPETVVERLKRVFKAYTMIPPTQDAFEELAKPVDVRLLEEAFRKIDDFGRLWSEYRAEYGETNLALAQALSWYVTHGGKTKAKKAEELLIRLRGP